VSGWPTPREWVGEGPYPWPQPSWLDPGTPFSGCFTVLATGLVRGPDGSAILELELADARAGVLGWAPGDAPEAEWLHAGLYVGVRGTIEEGGWQIRIGELSPLRVSLEDLPLFLPHTTADMLVLEEELNRLTASIREAPLRDLVIRLVGSGGDIGRGFRLAPAASRNHHACLGGLFEHTVSVARLCDIVADHYGDMVDRDLLIAGALLHDIGKVREIGARAGFPYTDEGRLLGHILLGLRMIGEAAAGSGLDPERRLLLEHLVASHQGRYEWQSPREPHILEGFILHYVDDLDAKVNHVQHALETVEAGWTEYDRSLRRELLRHAPAQTGGPGEPMAPVARSMAVEAEAGGAPSRTGGAADPIERKANRRTGDRKKAVKKKSAKKKASSRRKSGARSGGGKSASSGSPGSKSPGAGVRSRSRSGGSRRPAPGGDSPVIPAPGTPGFIDRDTLDLFEQTKGPTP